MLIKQQDITHVMLTAPLKKLGYFRGFFFNGVAC